jgi:adenylate cyclase
VQAILLERLYAAGARAVAFDLLFDTPSGRGAQDDASLAATLRRFRPRTVLAAQVLASQGEVAGLTLTPPLPLLRQASGPAAIGLLNGAAEPDGAIRRRPGDHAVELKRELGASVPAGLGVSLLRAAGWHDRSRPPSLAGDWVALLDPYGPPGTVPTLAVWNLLEPQSYQRILRSGLLRNRVILLGPTAPVFQDLHRTAFAGSAGMPGVEMHATELANRLNGQTVWFRAAGPDWALMLGLSTLVAMLLVERSERPLQRFTVLAGTALGLAIGGVVLVSGPGLAPQLFSMAAVVLLAAIVSSSEATARLQWQKRRLRSALARYLSPAVAAEIADQPREAEGLLGGVSSDVVVMMTDIRGFTDRTRRMSAAGRASELVQLNAYFTEVVAAIHGEGGTVDKFIGDAALAVFGAPLNRGRQVEAAAALRAALDLQERVRQLNRRWVAEHEEPWQQVILLNYGTVISGNVGSASRMDYTVIGDAVNVTSRMESIAKACGRELVMSASFTELLADRDTLENLGDFDLKGYGPTTLFAPLVHSDETVLGAVESEEF